MNESLAVLRILRRGGLSTLWPWLILVISFAVNLAFYAATGDNPDVVRQSGGILALFLTAVVANLQCWTQILPFTLGLSGTRRGFATGMSQFVLAQSVLAGVLLTAMVEVEAATGGWGMDVEYFRVAGLRDVWFGGQFLVFTSIFLAVSGIGATIGAVLVRWGTAGIWGLGMLATVLVGGALMWITVDGGWSAIIAPLASRSWIETGVLLPFSVALGCGTVAWLVVRRATIR